MKITYDSNNSGGSWWLKDEDWKALEKEGWTVLWITKEHTRRIKEAQARLDADEYTDKDREDYFGRSHDLKTIEGKGISVPDEDGRWLGALATEAHKDFETPGKAIQEWERITGEDASAEGCNCCGSPHSFEWGGKDTGIEREWASGRDVLEHLFNRPIPQTIREALEGDKNDPA